MCETEDWNAIQVGGSSTTTTSTTTDERFFSESKDKTEKRDK